MQDNQLTRYHIDKDSIDMVKAKGLQHFPAVATSLTLAFIGLFLSPYITAIFTAISRPFLQDYLSHLLSNPKMESALSAMVLELDMLSREGFRLRDDLTDVDGGFKEVAEEVIRQVLDEPEAKKQKHLGKLLAKAAIDGKAEFDEIHHLLKLTESLTFSELQTLAAFDDFGNPSGWHDNDLKALAEFEQAKILKLRNASLLSPKTSFEGRPSITYMGRLLCELMDLKDIHDLNAIKEKIDPLGIVYHHSVGPIYFNVNLAIDARHKFIDMSSGEETRGLGVEFTIMPSKNIELKISITHPTGNDTEGFSEYVKIAQRERYEKTITISEKNQIKEIIFHTRGEGKLKFDASQIPEFQFK